MDCLISNVDVALAMVGEHGFVSVYRFTYDDEGAARFRWRVLDDEAMTLQEGSDLRMPGDTANARGCVKALHAFVDFLATTETEEDATYSNFSPMVVSWVAEAKDALDMLNIELDEYLTNTASPRPAPKKLPSVDIGGFTRPMGSGEL